MRLPNLLATSKGRLTAFFCLYMTEGIPLGFAATAVATQLRRQDVGPAEIGAFVASFYLPWAFKWAFGPVIDVFGSERFGRRRGWILGTQVLMAATLLSTVLLKLPEQLWLFTVILLVHNTFGAMQDVAIDALACGTLQEHERGTANGVMFAGASIGQLIGGSGVLFLTGYTGFQPTFFFVAGCILLVTAFVVLPMREAASPARLAAAGSRLRAAGAEMHVFAITSFRSFLGTRGAFSGLLLSLLPAGAMCLGLSLQSNLAVELGLNDDEVAKLNAWSAVVAAASMVAGGWLSDRYGRRLTLSIYIAAMGLPVLYLMSMLTQHGWIMPVSPNAANRPEVPAALVTALWTASLVYSVVNGLMYGTRSAICMDVTNPRVAATQFTAYMALMNLTISYSAAWQGIAVEAWGYPRTMLVDVIVGLACIVAIPFMTHKAGAPFDDDAAPVRARAVAGALGLLCVGWVPYRVWQEALGAAQPIAGTVFTLVFIGASLFLLAGRAVLGDSARALTRVGAWIAPLLLAMYARYHIDRIAGWFSFAASPEAFTRGAEFLFRGVPLLAGLVLLLLALRPWGELRPQPAVAAAS
ncbi:MAG: MFS transporter [Betaproteobacteria bacterium]|nr:MFS transporter [Betaproteobacteria bacterium]